MNNRRSICFIGDDQSQLYDQELIPTKSFLSILLSVLETYLVLSFVSSSLFFSLLNQMLCGGRTHTISKNDLRFYEFVEDNQTFIWKLTPPSNLNLAQNVICLLDKERRLVKLVITMAD